MLRDQRLCGVPDGQRWGSQRSRHVHDGEPVNQGRRRFLTATTAVVGAVGAGFAAVPFIKSWNPSARAKLAGAPMTADISGLAEGQRLVLEWRGQPIWIVKRSKADARRRCRRWTAACAIPSRTTSTSSRPTRKQRTALDQAGDLRAGRPVHAPGLLAGNEGRDQARAVRSGMEGRLLLPLPQVALRHGRPRVPGRARADQPAGAAAPLRERHHASSSASIRREPRKPWRTSSPAPPTA